MRLAVAFCEGRFLMGLQKCLCNLGHYEWTFRCGSTPPRGGVFPSPDITPASIDPAWLLGLMKR
jgi:hypothetical protein